VIPSSVLGSRGNGSARSATKMRAFFPHRRFVSSTIAGLRSIPMTSAPSLSSHSHCAPDPQPASSTTFPASGRGINERSAGRSSSPLNGPSSVVEDHTGANRSYASLVRRECSAWLEGGSAVIKGLLAEPVVGGTLFQYVSSVRCGELRPWICRTTDGWVLWIRVLQPGQVRSRPHRCGACQPL